MTPVGFGGTKIWKRLYDKDKESGNIVRRADYIRVKVSNYTLLDFYMDEDLTTPLDLNYQHPGRRNVEVTEINPETNQEETTTISTNSVTLYVKYLAGKYDLISNKNIKTLTEASKWYLLEDVDLSEKSWSALSKFNGVIYGNGFALKNLTMTSIAVKPTGANMYKEHSIFGKFGGVIENLTFENVTFNVKTSYGTSVPGEQRVNFFAYEFAEKGSLSNVTIKDSCILLSHASCYQYQISESGLWWTAPAATQIENVTLQKNGASVETIDIVTEE